MKSLSTNTSQAKARVRSVALRGDAAGVASDATLNDTLSTFTSSGSARPRTAMETMEAERLAAIQRGYDEGLERARQEVSAAMEDANTRVRRALAALCEAVDSFDQRQAVALTDVEDAIVAGALDFAHAIMEREISLATDPGAEALSRALKLGTQRGDVIVYMNPDDAETLSMEGISTSTRSLHIVSDSSIEPGGCVVEVEDTRIDSQISSSIFKIRQALFSNEQIAEQTEVSAAAIAKAQQEMVAGSDLPHSRTTSSEAPLG